MIVGTLEGLGIGEEKTWPNIAPLIRQGASLSTVIEL
jgi:hypothetical protein